MEPLVVILLVSLGPLLASAATAIIAARSNAQWRERRAATLAARTADVVRERAAH